MHSNRFLKNTKNKESTTEENCIKGKKLGVRGNHPCFQGISFTVLSQRFFFISQWFKIQNILSFYHSGSRVINSGFWYIEVKISTNLGVWITVVKWGKNLNFEPLCISLFFPSVLSLLFNQFGTVQTHPTLIWISKGILREAWPKDRWRLQKDLGFDQI